ncbi:outer membrane beta-barrel protein [Zooshikella harenae]|uniref:Outer membrane beta-barrel protein n=1 Tax=Zooshikella harenae TaxID=2827238 RepID=A0ABS5Z9I4_9GAMM|nr:outer membrane beta-barrel protein [Zooshikella harenae]MBU2710707.1 outer membrane beta-barrel protein [Zooshikella harenae]
MKKTALVIAISSVVSTPLFAQDSINPFADEKTGFYLGLGVGAASYDDVYSVEEEAAESIGFSGTKTKRDGVAKVFGGYRINKFFALEANYTKFADTDFEASGVGFNRYITRDIENEISGYGVKAVGIYPVTKDIELNASAGLMKWKIEEERSSSVSGVNVYKSSETVKGTSKVFGLGASYNLTNNVAFGLDWERINDLGDKDKLRFGETDVDTFTLSAKYTF